MKFIIIILMTITFTACGEQMSSDLITPPPMTDQASQPGAYIIVMGKNYDPQDLTTYAKALPPIYAKYGGSYVAFAPQYDVLEGDVDFQAIIISQWPSVDAANAFWASPEYQEAKKLRAGIGEFKVVVLPALPRQE